MLSSYIVVTILNTEYITNKIKGLLTVAPQLCDKHSFYGSSCLSHE